jgi:ketosteroid isomerase-like protein
MSEANRELVRSLQVPPDTDVVPLFSDPAAWSAFAQINRSAFAEDFTAVGVGAPQGDVEGEGFDGLRDVFLEWLSAWASYRSTVKDVLAEGDKVMVVVEDHGVSRHDGVEVELRGASVWTLRDGRVARVEFHVRRDTALAAFEA